MRHMVMAVAAQGAFADMQPDDALPTGLLPSQYLKAAIHNHEIFAVEEISDDQIQPASLDLRLGASAYRIPTSFLPGPTSTVQEKIARFAMHRIDLSNGAIFEKGSIYLVELMEHLALRRRTSAITNTKSSIGRLDVLVRLVTDYGREFNRVPERYRGPLYAEIAPGTFSLKVRQGSRVNQMRVKRGSPRSSDADIRRLDETYGLLDISLRADEVKNGIPLTVDVNGVDGGIIGYRAKKSTGLVDIDKVAAYSPEEFWEPVYPTRDGGIILDTEDFYILASREAVRVPVNYAAELVAYDTLVGEFRVHYAGFFDPGFGATETHGEGSRAVLEVRSHEVPFLIEDGQIVGRLLYERLLTRPDRLYGGSIGSSYQRQGLALSKHFKRNVGANGMGSN
jgi:dCTP deaminase